MKIKELVVNNIVDIFLLIKNMKEKTTKQNKVYVELELFDGENFVYGKIWDSEISKLEFKEGDIVKFRARVNEWNEEKQLIIDKFRFPKEGEVNEQEFIKTSPIKGNEVYDTIIGIVNNIENNNLRNITKELLEDFKDKLLYYPGAQKVHHAEKLGLLYHTYRMLLSATKLPDIYVSLNKDLLYAGVILHDIGKVSEIETDKSCNVIEYSDRGILLGHIVEGIKFIERKALKLGIQDSQEVMLLEHILASHHGELEYGAIKKPMCLEAQVVHVLDNMDSKLYMMEDESKNIEKGCFSDKNYFLQRQIYKY